MTRLKDVGPNKLRFDLMLESKEKTCWTDPNLSWMKPQPIRSRSVA